MAFVAVCRWQPENHAAVIMAIAPNQNWQLNEFTITPLRTRIPIDVLFV
jgi:hypothetical protein